MSIRHDLVDLILMALDDPRATSIARVSATAGRRARVENGIDAILARYAVVELPEPIAQSGAGTGEWRPDEATTIFAYCGHVEFDGRDAWYESPAPARALAAALLAAAKRAEAADVDR